MLRSPSFSKSLLYLSCLSGVAAYYSYLVYPGPIFPGIGLGICGCVLLWSLEKLLKKLPPLKLNLILLGIFLGYCMYQSFSYLTEPFVEILDFPLYNVVSVALMWMTCYLGITITTKAQEEFAFSIPFFRFKTSRQHQRLFILDYSILNDERLLDLAHSGLFDQTLVLPKFVLEEAHQSKNKAILDNLKRLEEIPHLHLIHSRLDFPELDTTKAKLIKLGTTIGAHVLTADLSPLQYRMPSDPVRFISLPSIANILKSPNQLGDVLTLKIQRLGKEPKQGIGYLDDGTMVVVNGGGDYIGKTAKINILSLKHSSTGRIIFSNFSELTEHDEHDDLISLSSNRDVL